MGGKLPDVAADDGPAALDRLPADQTGIAGQTPIYFRVGEADGVNAYREYRATLTEIRALIAGRPAPVRADLKIRVNRGANVRAAPNVKGKFIRQVKAGTIAAAEPVLDNGYLKLAGNAGWIWADLISTLEE